MEVIEMHATWLTINSIIGCTNGCKYCFLQNDNNNLKKPKVLLDAKSSIEQLLNSKFYNKDIPICLLPNTDPFLDKTNIEYLKQLLFLIKTSNINNPITIVTKCYIPLEFIEYITKELDISEQIVFYLSYSGLDKTLEPNVNHKNIEENFKNLYLNGIKIIHYFRPIIPQNGTPENIQRVIDFVNKYTKYSVITGLKVKEDFIDKIDFWDEIHLEREKVLLAEGVWPYEAYNYIYNNINLEHYIFQTNYCALSTVLNRGYSPYYNNCECLKYNKCPQLQKTNCSNNIEDLKSKKSLILEELKKLGKDTNKVIINYEDGRLVLDNISLTVGDVSYLTHSLKTKICIRNKQSDDKYFNSSLVSAKPLIIKKNKNSLDIFINTYYEKAIELKNKFKITEEKVWDRLIVLNELVVQLGHLFNVFLKDDFVNEEGRKIDNLEDEISDLFLQIFYLSYLENYDLRLVNFSDDGFDDICLLPILTGQLTEAVMEQENYRFKKRRMDFNSIEEFIKDRINKIIIILYNLSIKMNIDLSECFINMINDAENFLLQYKTRVRKDNMYGND